jgi:hypothetical protein
MANEDNATLKPAQLARGPMIYGTFMRPPAARRKKSEDSHWIAIRGIVLRSSQLARTTRLRGPHPPRNKRVACDGASAPRTRE